VASVSIRASSSTCAAVCAKATPNAYGLSSNRSGPGAHGERFGGQGFAIDPDGRVLAATSERETWVTLAIDLERAVLAKTTYPCNVT
jgi:N-carbamoylputrescine amidase